MRAIRSGLQKQILLLCSVRDPNFFVTASPKVQPCWDTVVAGLAVMVPQEAEPNEPRGIFLEQGAVQASSTSTPAQLRYRKPGRAAAISVLTTLFELNRILLLSCTICTDSSVNSWSKLRRSRQKGACCFSPGLDPAQNNCVDCFIPCLAVQGLEIPHKRAQHTET